MIKAFFLSLLLSLIFFNQAHCQVVQYDTIFLENGTIVQGNIEELVPELHVKIRTTDGSLFVFNIVDVHKITKSKESSTVQATVSSEPKYDRSTVTSFYPQVRTTAISRREPVLSCLASVFLPGLGQIYNGQTLKGLSYMAWHIGSIVTAFGGAVVTLATGGQAIYGPFFLILGYLSTSAAWLTAVIDAPITSFKINRQLGLAHVNIGKHSVLSFAPDFRMQILPSAVQESEMSPVLGVSVRLSF